MARQTEIVRRVQLDKLARLTAKPNWFERDHVYRQVNRTLDLLTKNKGHK